MRISRSLLSLPPSLNPSNDHQWPSRLIPTSAFRRLWHLGTHSSIKSSRVQEEIICPPPQIQTICSRKQLCFSEIMLAFKKMALETLCSRYRSTSLHSPSLGQCHKGAGGSPLRKICTWHHEFSHSCKLLFNISILPLLCEFFREPLCCELSVF